MDFGEKREVGREILSLSNLLYRKIEYDKKKSGIYDLQYVQGGIIKYIKEGFLGLLIKYKGKIKKK